MTERILLGVEAGGMACALLISRLLIPSPIMTSAVVIFCFFYATHRLAPRFLPEYATGPRLFILFAALLGLQSTLQTATYYLGIPLNAWTDTITELASLGLLFFAATFYPSPPTEPTPFSLRSVSLRSVLPWVWWAVCFAPAVTAAGFLIWHAHRVATVEAIRTPWALLPIGTVLAFVSVFAAGWLAAWKSRSTILSWLIVSGFFVVLALITPLVYPLGFGFDGFLHRASETILFQTGALLPKPLYYIGQYTFVTWLARLLSLPVRQLDVFLLAGAIALLPATLAARTKTLSQDSSRAWLERAGMGMVGLALLLPLKAWITTTPQSFAYLIGASGLLLAATGWSRARLVPALVLGIWSAVIHPLAGLPLLGVIVLILARSYMADFPRVRFIASLALAFGSALIVPLAFFFNSRYSGAQIEWHASRLFSSAAWHELFQLFVTPALRISLWADWAAFVEHLSPLLLVALVAVSLWPRQLTTEHETERASLLRWLSLTAAFIMVVAWFMQQGATFAFLIDYERQDYTQRLFFIGQLILLPAAVDGWLRLWVKIKQQPSLSFYGFLLISLAWQGARVYHAFPYHDATHIEHGWSTSAAALEGIRWIEHDSQGQPYTVLADQAVSAGAVAELGFKRYADRIFFYPIPTGGPLYQVFLRAARVEATIEDIEEAARLGQSERVYLILNSYWWQAEDTAEHLKKLAGNEYVLDGGAVRVYRFEGKSAKK